MTIYRQGDILLVRVSGPSAHSTGVSVPFEGGRLILARGEATGHHHSVACADASAISTPEGIFLSIMNPTTLDHQEHGSIALEPGTYRVIRQREYQPGELPRQVAD